MENSEAIALQIIEEYENGKTLKEINKDLHLPISRVKRKLLEHGGEKGKKILLIELEKEIPMINEMIEHYQQGIILEQLSKQYGMNMIKIDDVIHKYEMLIGKPLEKIRYKNNRRNDLQEDEIVKEYAAGKTYQELAEGYRTCETTIRNRIIDYVRINGNSIREKHNKNREKFIEERKKIIKKDKKGLPIREIAERHQRGEAYQALAKSYQVSINAIKDRITYYETKKGTTIDLSMIVTYFRLGYDLDEIKQIAEEYSCKMDEKEIEIAQRIENGELKVATEESIAKIIKKYEYSYKELAEVGKEKGYIVLENRYNSAKANIQDKNRGGQEK